MELGLDITIWFNEEKVYTDVSWICKELICKSLFLLFDYCDDSAYIVSLSRSSIL